MSENILECMSYEHNLRHSFMYIRKQNINLQSYEVKLLRGTSVPAALALSIQPEPLESEPSVLQYEVSGMESMERYYADRKLHYLPLARLMENIQTLLKNLEEYFLPEDMVLLDPSAIFYDSEKESWRFTLVPGYAASFHEGIRALIAWLLKRIDYNEDRVVVLAYTLYNESMKEFLVMENLLRICRQNLERERRLQKDTDSTAAPGMLSSFDACSDQSAAAKLPVADRRTPEEPAPRRMISTDGIFRPVDAGLEPTRCIHREPSPDSSHAAPAEELRFPSDYGEDAYHKAVNTLMQQDMPAPEAYDSGLEGVSVSSLSEPEKPQGLFSFLSRRTEEKNAATEKATLRDTISAEKKHSSLKAKTILSVALMIFIPFLIWFLKGAAVFRRLLPLIGAVEFGILVVILLDYLMARMPDD